MHILLTGATGFVGRRLAARLAAEGHTVAGLSRDGALATAPGITAFFTWKSGERPPSEAIEPAAAIVHLAGETVNGRWTAAKKQRIAASRELGTRLLVEALAAAGGPRTLVSASAVGYYGDRGDEELTEASAPGGGFLSPVTQAWELETLKAEDFGCRVTVMRLGIILGSGGGALARLLPLFRFGLGGPMGSGRQWWSWIHADDAIAGLAAAVTQSWSGVFNLTSPNPVRQGDFAAALGRALHRPALLPTPAFALRLGLGEFADELLFSKRVLPVRLLESGFQFDYPEIDAALRQLVGKGADRDATLPSGT